MTDSPERARLVEACPVCEVPAILVHDRIRTVWKQTPVEIEDERYRCPRCGEEFYTLAQSTQHSNRALAAYDRDHGGQDG